ncbi:DUF4395 family protein [Marinilabiliaceae bacterium JC017]|nr:DUF4395 family protein [Marinilabiliaceae bacterium JC017]
MVSYNCFNGRFFVRGFGSEKYSLLSYVARKVSMIFSLDSPLINKAPKIFTVRLGLIFSFTGLLVAVFVSEVVSLYVMGFLVLFAAVECVLNFCVGCYIYAWIVMPLFGEWR